MAELLSHSNPLRRLMRRWNVASLRSGGGQIRELASWLTGTIQVDRDWPDDDRAIWGFTADYNTANPAQWAAVGLYSLSKEVLIRRIDYQCFGTVTTTVNLGTEVHIFTPPDSYNPCLLNPGRYYPFLHTSPGPVNTLSIPEVLCISGHQTGLMQVTIDGVLINPALGPRFTSPSWHHVISPGTALHYRRWENILDWSDPPIILPPYRIFAVQQVNPVWASGETLIVNYYVSEREV